MEELIIDDKDLARFWSKVDVKSENECWRWLGKLTLSKQGLINIKHKNIIAHRLSYYLAFKTMPKVKIYQTCKILDCCNPNHLLIKRNNTDYFWSRVDVKSPDECWDWLGGSIMPGGYGRVRWENRHWKTNQLAFYLFYGHKPYFACHKCNRPPCCNPNHLYDGNPKSNTDDMMRAGRNKSNPAKPGENHHNAKLTENQVLEILAIKDLSHDKIGKIYGVSQIQISRIKRGIRWKYLHNTLSGSDKN